MRGRGYCKYCYKTTNWIMGDGIMECEECGSGMEVIEPEKN